MTHHKVVGTDAQIVGTDAQIFGTRVQTAVTALCVAFLCAGCLGPVPLPHESLYPAAFIRTRDLHERLIETGRVDEARTQARALLDAERSAPNLTLAARIEEDLDDTIVLLDEAISVDPEFAWARYGLAFTILKGEFLERYEESAAHLEWLLDRDFSQERNPELRTRLLLIENLSRLGRSEAQADIMAKYLEYSPNDLTTRYGLAYLYCIKLKSLDEAMHQVELILRSNPDALNAAMLKGRVLWDSGEYSRAADHYQTLVARHPDALLNLGFLWERHLDDPERAIDYYERYLGYDGPNADQKRWYDRTFTVPNRIEILRGVDQ